jgi:phosphoribosylformylglycinamidine synthase
MASDVFDSESQKKKPTVQVGDPFVEKVVLEACLEAMRDASERGAIVAIQDMGAAGLTSSVFEMASRGKVGFTMDLDQVPLREPGLTAYEMMLSESQERMVLVVRRGREAEVTKVFRKWGLEVATIGEIRSGNRAEIRHRGRVVADLPIAPLTDDAPVYERPVREPAERPRALAASDVPAVTDPGATLAKLLGTPELGSKEWIWRQYDYTVRTNTVIGPGGDAAVLRLKGTPSGLALTSDVNPVYCALDPRLGGRQAIAEAVRNLACTGASPVGVTDCLNFGSPENPEILWQFREAVRGLAEACRAFEIPVISGNVSLYNETEGDAILPTPTVGMVGLIDNLGEVPCPHFRGAGDRIVLLGEDRGELGGSVYLRLVHGVDGRALGAPPAVDLDAEARLAALLREAIAHGHVRTAHDLAEGGLAVALAEATFGAGIGARLAVASSATNLFSETQARAVVAVGPSHLERFLALAEKHGVPAREAGETGGDRLRVEFDGGAFDTAVADLNTIWKEALPKALQL